MWLNGPAWPQMDRDRRPEAWCQDHDVDPELAISAVATEIQAKQSFDWNRYKFLNRVKNIMAECMTFKSK